MINFSQQLAPNGQALQSTDSFGRTIWASSSSGTDTYQVIDPNTGQIQFFVQFPAGTAQNIVFNSINAQQTND